MAKSVAYNIETHFQEFFITVQEIRDKFCDVILVVDGIHIPCHKLVLSAGCPYFKNMFNDVYEESKQSEIELKEQNPDVVKILVDAIYSGQITINTHNSLALLQATDFFQMSGIRDKCLRFIIETLTIDNCIPSWSTTKLIYGGDQEEILNFIIEKVGPVSRTKEFLSLSKDNLKMLLTEIKSVINKKCADKIYKAITSWLYYMLDARKSATGELLQLLPHKNLSKKCVLESMSSEMLIKKDFISSRWLLEIILSECWHVNCEGMLFILSSNGTQFWVFDSLNCTIHGGVAPIENLEGYTAVSYDKSIYIVGGMKSSNFVEIAYRYDFIENKWHSFLFPYIVTRAKACVIKDSLYLVGGQTSTATWTPNVVKYHFESGTITECQNITITPKDFHCCAIGESIFLLCNDVPMALLQFCTASDNWESLSNSLKTSNIHSMVEFREQLYCASSNLEEIRIFDLGTKAWNTGEPFALKESTRGRLVSSDTKIFAISKDGIILFDGSEWKIIFKQNFDDALSIFIQ